jgi:hypothetical protein
MGEKKSVVEGTTCRAEILEVEEEIIRGSVCEETHLSLLPSLSTCVYIYIYNY